MGNINYFPSSEELDGTNLADEFLNVTDVLIHKLGHFLGYPDETTLHNDGVPCALDGVMGFPAVDWTDAETPTSKGLSSDDPVRCWFKLAYCNKNCTASVAEDKSDPNLDPELYPNPSTGSCTLKFSLTDYVFVQVSVYDVLGNQVRMVSSGYVDPGEHQLPLGTESLPSGSYVCKVRVGDYIYYTDFAIAK